jgi:hypothetical protein
MNVPERDQVRDSHQKLPTEWESDYMSTFQVLSEQREDIWEKQYRESLEVRGFKFPKE